MGAVFCQSLHLLCQQGYCRAAEKDNRAETCSLSVNARLCRLPHEFHAKGQCSVEIQNWCSLVWKRKSRCLFRQSSLHLLVSSFLWQEGWRMWKWFWQMDLCIKAYGSIRENAVYGTEEDFQASSWTGRFPLSESGRAREIWWKLKGRRWLLWCLNELLHEWYWWRWS